MEYNNETPDQRVDVQQMADNLIVYVEGKALDIEMSLSSVDGDTQILFQFRGDCKSGMHITLRFDKNEELHIEDKRGIN